MKIVNAGKLHVRCLKGSEYASASSKEDSNMHCVKSVRIRSFSGPYSDRIRENTDQKNIKYGHFSRSDEVFCSTFLTIWSQYRYTAKNTCAGPLLMKLQP